MPKRCAVLHLQRVVPHQPKIGLMHQGGALQSLIVFACQATPCHPAQFVTDDRDESLPGRRVTLAPPREQLRDLVGRSRVQSHSPGQ